MPANGMFFAMSGIYMSGRALELGEEIPFGYGSAARWWFPTTPAGFYLNLADLRSLKARWQLAMRFVQRYAKMNRRIEPRWMLRPSKSMWDCQV
jgi:hypothetical protein